MDDVYRQIQELLRERQAFEVRLDAYLIKSFPVQAAITWERRGSALRGVVVQQASGGQLKVRNTRTHVEYWISAHEIRR